MRTVKFRISLLNNYSELSRYQLNADAGTEHTSLWYRQALAEEVQVSSNGSIGDALDKDADEAMRR